MEWDLLERLVARLHERNRACAISFLVVGALVVILVYSAVVLFSANTTTEIVGAFLGLAVLLLLVIGPIVLRLQRQAKAARSEKEGPGNPASRTIL